jgi:branched-chain amino acid transport system ATP-binding protein
MSPPQPARPNVVLSTTSLGMTFGGVNALDGVDISLSEGEILGVIGPNGAGKTTFINAVTGLVRPTRGSVHFYGADVTGRKAHEMAGLGLARTFQVVRPFQSLSVAENVAVGASFGASHGRTSRRHARPVVAEVLERVELSHKIDVLASELTIPDLKRLELARALAMRPKVLLLDEVMAGLHTGEIDRAVRLILSLREDGIAILVIEHVMRAIVALAERAVVLSFGKQLAEGPTREVLSDPLVVSAYLGERYAARQAERQRTQGVTHAEH